MRKNLQLSIGKESRLGFTAEGLHHQNGPPKIRDLPTILLNADEAKIFTTVNIEFSNGPTNSRGLADVMEGVRKR